MVRGGDVDGDEERIYWGFEGNAKIVLMLVCSRSVFSLSSIWSLEHGDGERAPCNRLGDGWLFLLARDICFWELRGTAFLKAQRFLFK